MLLWPSLRDTTKRTNKRKIAVTHYWSPDRMVRDTMSTILSEKLTRAFPCFFFVARCVTCKCRLLILNEALMFVYFLAQLVCALIERQLRNAMREHGLSQIQILPEDRPSTTPTPSK